MGIVTSPVSAAARDRESIIGRVATVPWLRIAIVLAFIGVLYGHVLVHLAQDWWTEPSLSHGLLIPPLALYVAWTRRNLTFSQPAAEDNTGLWLIFAHA
jgi:hypothetical protein